MFEYPTYKLVHFLGLFIVFTALAGRAYYALNGGTKDADVARKLTGAAHGTGLLLVLVGGFGMLAKSGMIHSLPGWVHAKLTLWLLVAAALALPFRSPGLARALLIALPLLGLAGAWLAGAKPF
ncbi:MAG: hypothetical protein H6739_15980 [Alphaproteobacteria bacterium]|nr:hypothetical protein [Alphaproteobacteria bacterium]